MWCAACANDLVDCKCSNKRERIQRIIDGGHMVHRMCAGCGDHYALCECDHPIWIRSDQEESNDG